jgi:hypothetical protein
MHAGEKATALRDRITAAEIEINRINSAVRTLLGEKYQGYLSYHAGVWWGGDLASRSRGGGDGGNEGSSGVDAGVHDGVSSAQKLSHNDFDQNSDNSSNGMNGCQTQTQTQTDGGDESVGAVANRNPLDEEELFDALAHVCCDDSERRALGLKVR